MPLLAENGFWTHLLSAAASTGRKLHDSGAGENLVWGLGIAFLAVLVVVTGVTGTISAIRAQKNLPRVPWPFVPFERYALETSVRPEAIPEALFGLSPGASEQWCQSRMTTSYGTGVFSAWLSDDGFKMTVPERTGSQRLKNPYLPVIVGVVRNGMAGSRLLVTIRPNWINFVPAGGIGGIWFLASLQVPVLFLPLAFVHACIYVLCWLPERATALSFLMEALRPTSVEPGAQV
jgi:hypothetical protein